VPPDSVWCTTGHVRYTRGLQRQLVTFGNFQRRLRYNSPDCPVYTGQCPVRQGEAASGTRQLRETPTASPLKFTGLSGATPEQRLLGANGYLRRNKCARSARRCQARPFRHTGQGTVDVRCAPDTQAGPQVRTPTATFGGWGYKYPNHPTIHCIQVFHFPTTTRALAFNSRHTKEIKSSPNSTQRHSD
jgi:hypothetical protein